MHSPIIFILRILGFTALISPVIAKIDACPPDRDFFFGDTRETLQPRNGERYYIQNEGATRYQATLIAAGLEDLYRLDRNIGEDVKTWRQPVTQTLLVYRGDRMFVTREIRHLRVWPYETFLREGSDGRTGRFKYLISPKRNPWPYGEIEETLENTVQWEQWMNAPLEGIPTIFLDQPTGTLRKPFTESCANTRKEQQFSLCMENMQWLYKLVTSVVTELLFHAEQFPSKQYDYNQITFTNWWN
ncbi:hypothetical protein FRC03_000781 [Tulasnella sp. 419]|nr:hypothetical protein FRC03_000781 [Tulasnella sp. 419]